MSWRRLLRGRRTEANLCWANRATRRVSRKDASTHANWGAVRQSSWWHGTHYRDIFMHRHLLVHLGHHNHEFLLEEVINYARVDVARGEYSGRYLEQPCLKSKFAQMNRSETQHRHMYQSHRGTIERPVTRSMSYIQNMHPEIYSS